MMHRAFAGGDEEGEIAVWTFVYTTYTVEDGGYVLYGESEETTSYVCMADENAGIFEFFAVDECTYDSASGTYSVRLTDGGSHTVAMKETDGTLIASVTPAAD